MVWQRLPGRERAVDSFRRFDKNRNGVIDKEELTVLLTALSSPRKWSVEEVDRLLLQADTNSDGAVQFDEFCKWLFSDSAEPALADAMLGGGDSPELTRYKRSLFDLLDKGVKAKSRRLRVSVMSASGLRKADWLSGSDPYCICNIPGKKDCSFQTPVCRDTHEPSWFFEEEFKNYSEGDSLQFYVMDKDTWPKADDFLGRVSLGSEAFYPNGFCDQLELIDTKLVDRAMLSIKVEVIGIAVRPCPFKPGDLEKISNIPVETGIDTLVDCLSYWQTVLDASRLFASGHELCLEACEAVRRLASKAGWMIEDELACIWKCSHVVELLAGLLRVISKTIFNRSMRHHVRRIGACTGAVLDGLVFELEDGMRVGEVLETDGTRADLLSDKELARRGARWYRLAEGEIVLKVEVVSSSIGYLAGGIALHTSAGRKLCFFGSAEELHGDLQVFEAAPAEEIEQVNFEHGACSGIVTVPSLAWPKDVLDIVRAKFRHASEVVATLRLEVNTQMGPRHAKYALASARQSSRSQASLTAQKQEKLNVAERVLAESNRLPTSSWDMSALHKTASGKVSLEEGLNLCARIPLDGDNMREVQAFLDESFSTPMSPQRSGHRQASLSSAPNGKLPDRLELVEAYLLQDVGRWQKFETRKDEVHEDLHRWRKIGCVPPTCSEGHEMSLVSPERGAELWSCNAALEPSGCKMGIVDSSRGRECKRYNCPYCVDYDLCEACAAARMVLDTGPGEEVKRRPMERMHRADVKANVQWLFHVANSSVVGRIERGDNLLKLVQGFDGLSCGKAIYLAESSRDCDRSCDRADEQADEHEGTHWMLLCRVVLGNVLHVGEAPPNINRSLRLCMEGFYHSVSLESKGHFAIYDEDGVYPELLLRTRRVYE